MKIVFLSHTARDSVFKVGSYHLSNEYARMGHDVLYISSALSPFHFLNITRLGDREYVNSLTNRLTCWSPKKDGHGILNFTPFVLTPFSRGIFSRPTIPVNQWFTFNRVGKKLKKIGFDHVDLVIQDKPGLFFMRKFIQANCWIYRATDDYSMMPGGPEREALQAVEQEVCQFVDRVVVTSQPLQKTFSKKYGVNASVIRNGVAISHFEGERPMPDEYQHLDKPIILYVGSLDQRFDLELLLQTAQKSPDYHFVVIGPGSKKAIPGDIENISALGPMPFEDIPAFMQHADIGILPLKIIESNHARSPMKIYEYGICGLPVISTPLRELQERNEHFVFFASDADEFHKNISQIHQKRDTLGGTARQAAQSKSWQAIAKQLLELADINSKERV